MAGYLFRESAIEWLKEKKFDDIEIETLQGILNNVARSHGEAFIRLPKGTSSRIAAMVYLLDSVVGDDNRPICFDEKGFIDIPREARNQYEDALKIEEFEDTIERLKRIKQGRAHSSPKRRGSGKKENY